MLKSTIRVAIAVMAFAAAGWLVWTCAEPRLRALTGTGDGSRRNREWSLEDVVASGFAILAVLAYGVFMATAVIAIASTLFAPRQASGIAARGWAGPTWWRTAVLAACGISVAIQGAPALAATTTGPLCVTIACSPSLDGLPYPDLPSGPWPGRSNSHAFVVHDDRPASSVVVRAGDSLWSIATSLSPPHADVADVARLVHRIYAANRSVVGDDPDLIYPGTSLRVPGGSS
jgi:hypothetical protein